MTTSAGDRFTAADYDAILRAARTHGYVFARFSDPGPPGDERVVYLRHDVDNTLEAALRMAETEARAEAPATYLIMVRSENYNPFSAANVSRIRRIRNLGHDVGLHFAPQEHDPAALAEDPASCIREDALLLERALGEPVRVFSFHNPEVREQYTLEVPGLVNAYADRFFANACYLSESNMRWPAGSPVDVLGSGEHRIVQILVHPLSYRADFRGDLDVLLWFLREKVSTLLELNVGQNRTLRARRVSIRDVADFLARDDR